MMIQRKIDLALEAKELAEGAGQLEGVAAEEERLLGFPLTRVQIVDKRGADALQKPVGTYLTLTLPSLPRSREEILRGARAVGEMLTSLPGLPREGAVLVAGLGNRQVTPDALGPRATDFLLVTRHLTKSLPKQFGLFRPVCALAPGVAGTTGLESGEVLGALVDKLRPACLIAVDALAARRQERVGRTIQISDTGIVPGSGVGNHRMALDEGSLGIPVFAVGVPTVVDAATLCLDLLEERGMDLEDMLPPPGAQWFVTPREIDGQIAALAKVLGLGISKALHVDFSVEEVENLVC